MRDFQIPGYKIERVLGQGGMATVYLAVQESLGRNVALKVMHNVDVPGFSERFLNEGRIIARLSHPHVITIFDIGLNRDCHYISMEYLQGGDLKKRINKGIDPQQALEFLEQLTDCLAFVHQKDIIHRDIKPANVLFRDDDKLVLTDFGIAKQLQANLDLTATGATLGSPHYLSPEQAEGKPVDGRSDVYSLGIMFYEMLTGEKPYQGENYVSTVMQHLSAPIPVLPAELSQYQSLLKRMLAKSPDERFSSAKSLLQAIRFVRLKSENITATVAEAKIEATASYGAKSRHEMILSTVSGGLKDIYDSSGEEGAGSELSLEDTMRRENQAKRKKGKGDVSIYEMDKFEKKSNPLPLVIFFILLIAAIAFGVYSYLNRDHIAPDDNSDPIETNPNPVNVPDEQQPSEPSLIQRKS